MNKILKKSNVTYWIEGGTLLGAIRDNKLIPWDHDLDLGMKFFNQNQMIKLIKELKKEQKIKEKIQVIPKHRTVIKEAPLPLTCRPNKPATVDPIKGKKTRVKYIL